MSDAKPSFLHVPPQQHPSILCLWLHENGIERVKLVVEGVLTNFTLLTSAKILSEMDTDVRVVISPGGIGRVFPRPSGFVQDDGCCVINGQPCANPDEWADVWPSIRECLKNPGERFFAHEDVPNG